MLGEPVTKLFEDKLNSSCPSSSPLCWTARTGAVCAERAPARRRTRGPAPSISTRYQQNEQAVLQVVSGRPASAKTMSTRSSPAAISRWNRIRSRANMSNLPRWKQRDMICFGLLPVAPFRSEPEFGPEDGDDLHVQTHRLGKINDIGSRRCSPDGGTHRGRHPPTHYRVARGARHRQPFPRSAVPPAGCEEAVEPQRSLQAPSGSACPPRRARVGFSAPAVGAAVGATSGGDAPANSRLMIMSRAR